MTKAREVLEVLEHVGIREIRGKVTYEFPDEATAKKFAGQFRSEYVSISKTKVTVDVKRTNLDSDRLAKFYKGKQV